MLRHRLFVGAVAAGALIAGILLVPQAQERHAISLRDLQTEAAQAELQRLYDAGDRRSWVVVGLAMAHHRSANSQTGVDLLDAYVQRRPNDTLALAALADLARSANRREAWIAALRQLAVLAPTRERITQVLGHYRLQGDTGAELAVLTAAPPQHLDHSDLVRFAGLLISAARSAEALAPLRRANAIDPADWSEGRALLFTLLMTEGLLDEARTLALDWTRRWTTTWQVFDLVRRAADLAPHAFALSFAEQITRIKPAAEITMIGMLATEGKRDIARALLGSWEARHPVFDPAEFKQYLAAARATGNASSPFQSLVRQLKDAQTRDHAVQLAEMIASGYGMAALAPVRALLGADALKRRPLFAAELALADNDLPLALDFLRRIKPGSLVGDDRRRWHDLQRALPSGLRLSAASPATNAAVSRVQSRL
jgi:hypothetical protein